MNPFDVWIQLGLDSGRSEAVLHALSEVWGRVDLEVQSFQ